MKIIFVIFLLICTVSTAQPSSQKIDEDSILDKISQSEEVQSLRNKIKNSKELDVLKEGIESITKETIYSIKNIDSEKIKKESAQQIKFWNECLYTLFKVDGVRAAHAVEEFAKDPSKSKLKELAPDKNFKNIKVSAETRQKCLSKVKK